MLLTVPSWLQQPVIGPDIQRQTDHRLFHKKTKKNKTKHIGAKISKIFRPSTPPWEIICVNPRFLGSISHVAYTSHITLTSKWLRWRLKSPVSRLFTQFRLFGRRSKKTSKLRVTGLCVGNSPGPVNSPHQGPITRKMFSFDDVIMSHGFQMKWGFVSYFWQYLMHSE